MSYQLLRCRLDVLMAAALFALITGCASPNGPALSPQIDLLGSPAKSVVTPAHAGKGKHVVYVSNLYSNVTAFPASIRRINPPPVETISNGMTRPVGLWVDRSGTLYVVNTINGSNPVNVMEYKRGKTSPFRELEQGLVNPQAVGVAADGTVYVSDVQQNKIGVVVVYKRGQSTPETTITLPDPAYALQPGGIAFDAKGNVLVATEAPETNTVHVFSIVPGVWQPTDLGIQDAAGSSIALDGSGNLYTAGTENDDGAVAVYAPGSTIPTRSFNLGAQIDFITVAADGTLYAGMSSQAKSGVAEVAPGGDTIANFVDNEQTAYGVALGSG